MAAIVLLYQAYGFGIGKNGNVIQNGLTFFSSHPNPASIYVDGKLAKVKTNTRLVLPEGTHHVTLARDGYVDWQRIIQLDGGKVEHYDYPFLVPKKLTAKKVATYQTAPALYTQSLDKRWLLAVEPANLLNFDMYDLKNPEKPAESFSLPSNLLTNLNATSTWKLVEWADDNQHLLLKHTYAEGKFEYILVSRTDPATSQNITQALGVSAPEVTLKDRKYDKYYLYDQAAATLQTTNLKAPQITPVLQHVYAYKSYGDNTVLYATDNGAPAGKVLIKLKNGDTTYTLRSFDAGTSYLVDLTKYSNDLYVVVGASASNKVYIYKDPLGQLRSRPKQALVPTQVMRLPQPNKLSFSSSAQYIVAENSQEFGVYDIENTTGYKYTAKQPIDQPQPYASWMDGNRLTYVSNGKQLIFDYDDKNSHLLAPAAAGYLPAFTPDYGYLYTLAPSQALPGQFDIVQTSLLTPADQK
jgi:hypothetical protein